MTRADSPDLYGLFREPPKAYRPMVRWYWPGGDVRDDQLRREIALLDEAGFGGAEIQAFRMGLDPVLPPDVAERVDSYLTPEFFRHVRVAVEEAASRGMWVDLTFGSGWPFGGPWVTPEHASAELRFAVEKIHGPATWTKPPPRPESAERRQRHPGIFGAEPWAMPDDWDRRLRERERIVAVLAVPGDDPVTERGALDAIWRRHRVVVERPGRIDPSRTIVLTDRLQPDGTLHWDVPEGDWLLFAFTQNAGDMLVAGGVCTGPQLVVDHFNRDAMQAYIDAVGSGILEHLGPLAGRGLRAIFCDSLEVEAYLYWSDDFLEQFRTRRGYDLAPLLPLLPQPGTHRFQPYESPPLYDDGTLGERVRRDYWLTVSDVMIDGFFVPFVEWARDHGLLARVQAHGSPADLLRIYGMADIGETENLYGRENYDFLRYAASATHVYGGSVTSAESFVWAGLEYRVTPERMKRLTDKLLTAGVNQIIVGGFAHEYQCPPEPGWYPFVYPFSFSVEMNHHNPFWRFMPALTAYTTRLQLVSQLGRAVTPLAVYRERLDYPQTEELDADPPVSLVLFRAGYAFDHVNAHALLASTAGDGVLVSPGGAEYRGIVLTDARRVSLELAEALAHAADAGVTVVIAGDAPAEEAGLADHESRTERIRTLTARMLERPNVHAVASVDNVAAALDGAVEPNVRFAAGDASFIQWRVGDSDAYLFRNESTAGQSVDVLFPHPARTAESWDPWTGDRRPLPGARTSGHGCAVTLDVPPIGSALVVFDPQARHEIAAAQPLTETASLALSGPWTLRARGRTLDGVPDDHDVELDALVDWASHETLAGFSGTGAYTIDVELDASWIQPETRIELDLGDVRDVAEVRVNGRAGPTLLARPYLADVTGLVRAGRNEVEVTVTNALANRMVAAGVQMGTVFGWVVHPPTPQPSGLLGPVRLVARRPDGAA